MKQILPQNHTIQIIDVGASDIEELPIYRPLMEEGLGSVTGFEPSPEMFEKLSPLNTDTARYLPYALGDGTEQSLKICRAPGMTSLLEPDMEHLNHFHGFDDWAFVEERLPMQTHRLDDISEIDDFDLIKIDTQGAEFQIIDNGRQKMSNALVAHVELSFKPIYHGEKSFSEVDLLMRDLGFYVHTIASASQRAFRPMIFNNSIFEGQNHILQVEAVFIKDFQKFGEFAPEKLLSLSAIMHYCYSSYDVALLALKHYDEKSATDLATAYTNSLS